MNLFGDAPESYRVLARKYRPAGFEALIGQDALVQTLANAFATNRLAQAWLLTGVRGVGKTTTARIIAKALNCVGPDGTGGPSISPCGECPFCTAISAGSHIDVIEMDAASNTGVDDVREIIEAVRYRPASARYKVYIIDEVHMLSRNAWNALLKTLEEPPPHVKFIFATTEVEKLPPTILSRCQRFDLRRVPHSLLVAHFAGVATAEGAQIEPEAIDLVALAADGSVRDGLSILDQAIALGAGKVTAAQVREMLGLADRRAVVTVLDAVLNADARAALDGFASAHAAGTEPGALFEGLLALLHATTRTAISGAPDPALGETEREAVGRWAKSLDLTLLHRLWQLALKGVSDIRDAPRADHAAEMALLRMAHGAALPGPGEALNLPDREAQGSRPDPAAAAPRAAPATFEALVSLVEEAREADLARLLTDCVALKALAPGRLELVRRASLPRAFASRLAALLRQVTGGAWQVQIADPEPRPAAAEVRTLREAEVQDSVALKAAARADPVVSALIEAFPEAELTSVEPAAAPGVTRGRRHAG
jgi:DNA polymerase-3 subunit gamma/tau